MLVEVPTTIALATMRTGERVAALRRWYCGGRRGILPGVAHRGGFLALLSRPAVKGSKP